MQFYPLTTGLGSGQDPHYSSDTQPWSFCYNPIGGKDAGLSLGVAERLMTILPLWGENLPEGSPQRRTELREGEGKTESSGQCLGSESSHPWKQIPWILPSCETSDSFSYVCIQFELGFCQLQPKDLWLIQSPVQIQGCESLADLAWGGGQKWCPHCLSI